MRTYEYILLLKPDLTDEQVQANVDRFRSVVEEKGRIFLIDFWGKKKLAYEIRKFSKGFYFRFIFIADPDHVEEIERICRINSDVVRFLTVKLSDKAEVEKLEEEYGAEATFTLKRADLEEGEDAAVGSVTLPDDDDDDSESDDDDDADSDEEQKED